MTKFEDRAKKTWNNIIKIVYNPKVRSVSRFAASLLEMISYVDKKSPFSLATAAIAAVDSAVDAFDIPLPSKIEQYVENLGLVEYSGILSRIVSASGLTAKYKAVMVCVEAKVAVKKIEFPFGNYYFVEHIDTTAHYQDNLDRIQNYYYADKEFEFEKLFDLIWETYGNSIYISKVMENEDFAPNNGIRFHTLSTSDSIYIGENPKVDTFAEEVKAFVDQGTSRSFMLAGGAGCGKTSFSISVAKHLGGRILKMDPSIARIMGSGEFEFVIKNLRPDLIMLDDFDRAAMAGAEHLLFLLENIKQQFPKIIIFATVNNFDGLDKALVRPGRFDRIVWFELPTDKERRQVAAYYLDKTAVKYTKRNMDILVEETDGMSQAYIKELCIRLRHQGWSSLDSIIKEFRRTLSVRSHTHSDEFEDGEDIDMDD